MQDVFIIANNVGRTGVGGDAAGGFWRVLRKNSYKTFLRFSDGARWPIFAVFFPFNAIVLIYYCVLCTRILIKNRSDTFCHVSNIINVHCRANFLVFFRNKCQMFKVFKYSGYLYIHIYIYRVYLNYIGFAVICAKVQESSTNKIFNILPK